MIWNINRTRAYLLKEGDNSRLNGVMIEAYN